jgi:multiple sugar transport system permease protein
LASKLAVNAILLIATLYFLLPVFWLTVAATKGRDDLVTSFGFWFSNPQLATNLRSLFTEQDGVFGTWMLNSLLYSGVGALIGTLLAGLAGYGLAVYRFRGREVVFSVILGSVLVPSTALALPTFLLFANWGLTNTYWAVLLPSIISPFGVYLCRIYTEAAVPVELIESGRVDGAGEGRIFATIASRLISPALVTVFLFQFVGIWNNFLLPLIMLQDERLYPVTLGLFNWQSQLQRSPQLLVLVVTGAFVSVIPLVVTFVALQRYWRAGLAGGAVKG